MFVHLRRGFSKLDKLNSHHLSFIARPKVKVSNSPLCISSIYNSTSHRQLSTKVSAITFRNNKTIGPVKRFMSYNETNEAHKKIHNLIANSTKRVFVFIRGNPNDTSCKYSQLVLQILAAKEADYDTFDVTLDPGIELGLATYANSPKVPQLFIDGSPEGDFDSIVDMDKSGKLDYLLHPQKSSSALTDSSSKTEGTVPEEEFVLSSLIRKEIVPEVPLMSLGLDKRIQKVKKSGSFSADLFTGSYDDDFLIFPDPLENRDENRRLKDQAHMVKQLWPQIWNDPLQLQNFNFNHLFQLSVTEMMLVFESIGASMRNCCDSNNQPINDYSPVTKSIISLITRNCLTYWPMSKSENYRIKEYLPKKDIIFGGASVEDEGNRPLLPIGFCWTEMAPELGSLPPQEWLSLGQHGGRDVDQYLIKGVKHRVLLEESTENYLVYFRDKYLAEKYNQECPSEEPNPASDPFVGCCLVDKSQLKFGPVYQDSAGFNYTDVEFDTLVPGTKLLFAPERRKPTAVNIKGLGQCATSAVLVGLLKDTLSKTYIHLISSKRGLLTCDIIERKLASITSKIFSLESMLYYIAGMYDGLEGDFDAHMEAAILKTMSNEFAFEILRDVQQIFGSEMFILSKLQDQVNVFDSFLDGNIHNRLYIATMGIIWYARSKNAHLNQLRLSPWYPGYFLKHSIKETAEQNDWITLDADIYGNLHPSLKEAAVNLEYIIKRVKWATENTCMKYGAEVTGAQSSLYQLSQLTMDVFSLTAMCARASKNYCNGSRNADLDVALTTDYSHDLYRRTKLYMAQIQTITMSALQNRSREISQVNLKYGGYYAESPLDPNI